MTNFQLDVLHCKLRCAHRCGTRARRVTPNLDHFECGADGQNAAWCHNCSQQLVDFKSGQTGWTYYWLPHSFKYSENDIVPLMISMSEKISMSQETMELQDDEQIWKELMWAPVCCNCIISEFMINSHDFEFIQETKSKPATMRRIIDEQTSANK